MMSANALRGQICVRSAFSHAGFRRARVPLKAPGVSGRNVGVGDGGGARGAGAQVVGSPEQDSRLLLVRGLGGDHAAVLCAARHHPALPHLTSPCRTPVIIAAAASMHPSLQLVERAWQNN